MAEEITFNFKGALSDEHALDFYEAGRFQYGAARLMVKLDQFRRTGRFTQKITSANNTRIILQAQREGSFDLTTFAPAALAIQDAFVQAPIGLLWSYVVDRIFKPATNDNLRDALSTQRDLIETFNNQIVEQGEVGRRTLDLLENRIDQGDAISVENRELRERLLAETERRAYLEGQTDLLSRISIDQDTKLITMAAPLLKDLGIAMRSSATSLNVTTDDNSATRPIFYLNRQMASEVETTVIDDQSTLLLVEIIQYNVENGWGKLRMSEHEGLLSFNVPSDRKRDLQRPLLDAMDEDDTYIECLFVRSTRGIRQRAIILSIRDIDEIERGIIG